MKTPSLGLVWSPRMFDRMVQDELDRFVAVSLAIHQTEITRADVVCSGGVDGKGSLVPDAQTVLQLATTALGPKD